jgi:predicted dehydrogenase
VADLDDLLARVDAVAITSVTRAHAPLNERAAGACRHILCEKPLATSMAEADRIVAAVAAGGVAFMQSFPKRFDPVTHEIRRTVRSGELGRIHMVRVRHGHFYGLEPDFAQRWYVDPAQAGGGALLDEGVHGADLLCWLFGLPESVTATVSSAALGLGVEDTGLAVFQWRCGLVAELASSFLFAAADSSIEIYGTEGTLLVSGVDLASRDITEAGFVRSWRRGQPTRAWSISPLVPRFKLGGFHHQNAIAFAASLRSGQPPPIGLADGRRALLMIERAYAAARTGMRQTIEDDDSRAGGQE